MMGKPETLYQYANMSEEEFKKCIGRIEIQTFIENPTQALRDVGINLKEGMSIKFVASEEEAKSLPSNVIPIKVPQENNEALSMNDLDKVAGGFSFADITNYAQNAHKQTSPVSPESIKNFFEKLATFKIPRL